MGGVGDGRRGIFPISTLGFQVSMLSVGTQRKRANTYMHTQENGKRTKYKNSMLTPCKELDRKVLDLMHSVSYMWHCSLEPLISHGVNVMTALMKKTR